MALNICNFDPLDLTSTPLSSDGGYSSLDPTNCNTNTSIVDTILNCDGTNNINQINTDKIANEIVERAGMRIYYYRHLMDIKGSHPIYGDSCAEYSKPYLIKGYVNITTDESFLAFGGIMNTNDVELQISFDEWNSNIGSSIAPQANDKFSIPDLLCDRPSGFTNATFKVTSQGDGDLFQNASRWTITAKRDASNSLPNEPEELINDQVLDSNFAGLLDLETSEPTEDTDMNEQQCVIDDVAKVNYHNKKSKVYGNYYED